MELRKQNQEVALKGTSLTQEIPATFSLHVDHFQNGTLFRIVILYCTGLFSLNH